MQIMITFVMMIKDLLMQNVLTCKFQNDQLESRHGVKYILMYLKDMYFQVIKYQHFGRKIISNTK